MTAVHNQVNNTLKQIHHKQSTIHLEKAIHFNVDDWVLVHRRNLKVKAGNNHSRTNKWIGPHKVTKAVGSHAYQLEVLEGTRWYNVVHTTLLKPFRRRDEPQDMDNDDSNFYEVESIIDSRRNRGVVNYRVRWVGYTQFKDTREMLDMLNNCPLKLQEFLERFPNKPHDLRNV